MPLVNGRNHTVPNALADEPVTLAAKNAPYYIRQRSDRGSHFVANGKAREAAKTFTSGIASYLQTGWLKRQSASGSSVS